jgi:hypothetical protein
MTVPAATQPNIQPGLSNQNHIALNLFDTILKTANTGRNWNAHGQPLNKILLLRNSWKLDNENVEILISFPIPK